MDFLCPDPQVVVTVLYPNVIPVCNGHCLAFACEEDGFYGSAAQMYPEILPLAGRVPFREGVP